ncbi:hypothetical protein BC829DRAFT_487276 [Chytridium lagenaria]|nr:hypothetical protein BC829DRAFT_487276 [Chytridium lagenaria]
MDPYTPHASSSTDPLEDLESEDQRKLAAEQAITGHIDLYAVLNLNKEASGDDIKNAYRRMCVTFHPDKHQRPEDKEAAERQFQTIQKAYDVLSNPGRRHIYDMYGQEGLTTNWEVGPRLRTPEEIREEYDRQNRQRLQSEVDNLIRSKGEILVGLNASPLFERFYPSTRKPRISQFPTIGVGRVRKQENTSFFTLPEITQAYVKHSWETKIAPQTDFHVQGSALARNGVGAGTVSGTLRHVISPLLWGELTGSLGQNPSASLKLVKNFSSDIFSTVHIVSTTPSQPPPITVSVGRKLTDNITGYMTYRTGGYTLGPWGEESDDKSSCAVGIVRKTEVAQWVCDVSAGEAASFVSLSYLRVVAKGTRGRVAVVAGTSTGVQASVSVDKKVNKHDKVGLGVECGTLSGIVLRLKFIRLGQKLSVPIIISPQLNIELALWTTIVPLVASYTFDKLVFEPWRQKKFAEKLKMIRLENAEVLAERKRNAEDAIKLMKDQVQRKVDAEEMKNGLIIIEALYGKLPPTTTRLIHKDISFTTLRVALTSLKTLTLNFIDVTLPVQNLVVNSQLHINGGYREGKRLRIVYAFRGNLHFLEVDDTGGVAAPLRGHLTGERRA